MNNQEYLKVVGERLRAARHTKTLSLRGLSTCCDTDHADLCRMEKGRVDIRISTLINISHALEINPADILNFQPNERYEKQ